jgi:hypothetical protein
VSAVELARVSWRVAVLQAQLPLQVAVQLEAANTQAEVVQQERAPRARVLRAAPVHRVMTTRVLRSVAAAARARPAQVRAALVDRPHRVVAAVRARADRAAARPADRAVRVQVALAVEVALREPRVVAAAFPEPRGFRA